MLQVLQMQGGGGGGGGGEAIAVRTLSQNDHSYGVSQTSHVLIRVFSS